MQRVLEFLSGARFIFGGFGLVLALLLVIGIGVLMPRGQRRLARLPAMLLLLHFVATMCMPQLEPGSEIQRTFEVAAIFLLLACVGRAGFVLAVDWFLSHRLRQPLPRIFRDLLQVLVYVGVAFITLRELGVELGSLLTTSALLTAVIGLSLQETLGNLFAGLAIQAQQPFRVGHWIQIEGTPDNAIGQVLEINWRATTILTDDRVEIIIPNGMLAKSPIRNFSVPSPVSRRKVRVQGPYDVAPHRVEAALLEAARGCPGVLGDPPPTTWVSLYADSGIEYSLVYFIDDFAARPVIDSRIRRRIWYALQRAGISVPFPVRDVRTAQTQADTARASDGERVAGIERVLRGVYFLESLSDAAFAFLAGEVETRLFATDEDIIRQGDEGNELFILHWGSAAVLVTHPGQDTVEVARLGSGDVVGEMSLVTGEARSATVRATKPCECFVIGHDAFRSVLEKNPELAHRISEVLATRQAELRSARTVVASEDTVTVSGLLLHRIRSFFSLTASSAPPGSQTKS
ncbi:MAG: mechanosensitive ion channel family protein [Polyangiaceae bacterium]|nr:mechanosensitive ion channel family protein [Polyangiaceae bacterium]